MPDPKLEEVFKISGVPTITFIEPSGFDAIKVALRTTGRGLVIEGPSGIGKSTAVAKALTAIGKADSSVKLSARIPEDVEYISMLPQMRDFGLVVIDDYHRLPENVRQEIADLLKVLADTEDPKRKLVIVGINSAGDSLIADAPDLANRIETIKFEVEQPRQIEKMVTLGEAALNVSIEAKQQIVAAAQGSFYIAQLLCFEMCLSSGVTEATADHRVVNTSFTEVSRSVLVRQEARFGQKVRNFARGTRFRPSGRAPYLHILTWLRDASSWSIRLSDEIARHPNERISVSQVVELGYLAQLVKTEGNGELFHFDTNTKVLSIEDPHLAFYLRNLDWNQFVRDAGFTRFTLRYPYDVALSFAGEDRAFAEALFNHLSDEELAVFYDLAEQHRILAQDVEDYLRPIYESEARIVVAVLGEKYGIKRWTIFESDVFRPRIDAGEVIPVWSTKVPPSAFDATRRIGGMSWDPDGDLDEQARACAKAIAAKIGELPPTLFDNRES